MSQRESGTRKAGPQVDSICNKMEALQGHLREIRLLSFECSGVKHEKGAHSNPSLLQRGRGG